MQDSFLFIELINDVLNWREYSYEVLRDYLEERGFDQKFYQHGGIHTRVGVVRALINIGAINLELVDKLDMPLEEQQQVLEMYLNE